jgi:hypothetical protein
VSKTIDVINKSKNAKELWTNINNFKGEQFKMGTKISMGDWISHYQKLYTGSNLNSISYVEQLRYNKEMDSNFTMVELNWVLDSLKENIRNRFNTE